MPPAAGEASTISRNWIPLWPLQVDHRSRATSMPRKWPLGPARHPIVSWNVPLFSTTPTDGASPRWRRRGWRLIPNSALPYGWMLLGAIAFSGMASLAHVLGQTIDWQIIATTRTALALVFATL